MKNDCSQCIFTHSALLYVIGLVKVMNSSPFGFPDSCLFSILLFLHYLISWLIFQMKCQPTHTKETITFQEHQTAAK